MYVTDIRYEPVIVLKESGEHFPMLRVLDSGVPKLLELLGADEMQVISEVEEIISKIKNAADIELEEESYIFKKTFHLKIRGGKVAIYPESASEDFIILNAPEVLKMLIHWKTFLIKYKNKEIEGLVYLKQHGT